MSMAAYQKWRPDFEAVMDDRLYTIGWLDAQVWSGQAWFWGNDKAGIVAELRHYPTGAFDLHGLVAAGDVGTIRDNLIPQAEAWARSIGAIGAIIESRPAWAKLLAGSGYEPHQTSLRKELA
jgi:hypothetical protein